MTSSISAWPSVRSSAAKAPLRLGRLYTNGVLALASLFVFAACASSQPDRRQDRAERRVDRAPNVVAMPIALLFATMDADKDRAVSFAELDAALEAEWALADSDGNGMATALEFANWSDVSLGSQDTLPNRLSFDRDVSGSVSETEFAEGMAQEFNRLDANKDQILTRAELLFVRPARAPQGEAGQRQRPNGGNRGGGGGRGGRGRRPGG